MLLEDCSPSWSGSLTNGDIHYTMGVGVTWVACLVSAAQIHARPTGVWRSARADARIPHANRAHLRWICSVLPHTTKPLYPTTFQQPSMDFWCGKRSANQP